MLRFKMTAKGVFALARMPRAKRERQFVGLVKDIHRGVLSDYVTGKMSPSINDRMKPGGFMLYGLTRRSDKYMKRQVKVLGMIRPYYSPRRNNYTNIAKLVIKAASGKGVNGLALVKAVKGLENVKRPHMYDLIKVPGIGHSFKQVGKNKIKTSLKLPGARVLNRAGPRSADYRREFTDLKLGGGRDERGILAEMHSRITDRMHAWVRNAARIKLEVG